MPGVLVAGLLINLGVMVLIRAQLFRQMYLSQKRMLMLPYAVASKQAMHLIVMDLT